MAGRGSKFVKLIGKSNENSDSGIALTDQNKPSTSANLSSDTLNDTKTKFDSLSITTDPASIPHGTKELSKPRGRGRGLLLQKLQEMNEAAKMAPQKIETVDSGVSLASLPSSSESLSTPSEPVISRGQIGRAVEVAANYIRLESNKDAAVYEYEVRFDPPVVSQPFRNALLRQHMGIIHEGFTFDGVALFMPKLLDESITVLKSTSRDGKTFNITILFKKKMRMGDCVKLYNLLFDKIMKILKYVRHNRKQFDPTEPILIPQQRLEIWPGHITSVNEFEGGLMCNLDVSFRVLNTQTVLDKLHDIYHISQLNFQKNFQDAILGKVVLTRYNNKTYRIDEVLWDENPMTTFETTSGEEITFRNYYKHNYQIEIKDLKQPLLLHYETKRVSGKKLPEERKMCLIPEICFLTGLTDEMRNNYKVMKDIASHTRVTPNQRTFAMRKFIQSVNDNAEACKVLSLWGLKLADSIVHIEGRVLPSQEVHFHNQKVPIDEMADFNKTIGKAEIIDAINIDNWLLVYTKRDQNMANKFIDLAMRNARLIGIIIQKPTIYQLDSDSTASYVDALRRNLNQRLQIVVIMVPTQREDRYSAIKRIVCCENPIPSQVLLTKTLSNERTARNVVLRVLLQMICKMGGSLWSIPIPMKNVMIIGVDTFHSADKQSSSVAAFIASMNNGYTKWYSRAVIQNKKEEIMNGLAQSLLFSLKEYKKARVETDNPF